MVAFDCTDPGIPANGYRDGDRFNIGDSVKFGCHLGYAHRGSKERTCKENDTWTGTQTFCDSKYFRYTWPLKMLFYTQKNIY